MDSFGKPRASRELINRLSAQRPDDSRQAIGRAMASSGHISRDARRKVYRDSYLGSRRLADQSEYRRAGVGETQRTREVESLDLSNQRISTDENRPSAGFKEPPGRSYNPYS